MKPSSLAVPPQDSRRSDTARLESGRVLQRALDETYFRVEIEPGVGVHVGVPVVIAGAPGMEDWPAGAVTGRRRTRRLRSLWPKTVLRLNLWYTSPVGSTNNFAIRWNWNQYDAAVPSGIVFSEDFTTPGPAVAGTHLFVTRIANVLFLPAPRVCQFSLLRVGPDANANDFRLLLAEVALEERA